MAYKNKLLENLEPVDPIKMRKSADKYNASLLPKIHKIRRAQANSKKCIKNL